MTTASHLPLSVTTASHLPLSVTTISHLPHVHSPPDALSLFSQLWLRLTPVPSKFHGSDLSPSVVPSFHREAVGCTLISSQLALPSLSLNDSVGLWSTAQSVKAG